MQAQTADGKRLWTINAESGSGDIGPSGDSADLHKVNAVLYEENKPAITLTADSGRANEETGKLLLAGRVRANSADGHTKLTCDRITWQREDRILVARGNVSGTTAGMALGPADEARAKFKAKDNNMKNTTAATLVLVSLTLQGKSPHYRDHAGNMDVSFTTFGMTYNEQLQVWKFTGTGPLTAKWLKQGLTVTGDKMEGSLVRVGTTGSESYELRSGRFSGNIHAVMNGSRGKMDLSGLDVWSVDLSENEKTWIFKGDGGPFTATFPDNGAVVTGRHFEGTADRNKTAAGESPEWETGKFTGGVKATITQKDKKTGKTFTINGECPSVTITRSTSKMVLSGGVRVSGNHPSIGPEGAEAEAGTIILTFDPQMQRVVDVQMERD